VLQLPSAHGGSIERGEMTAQLSSITTLTAQAGLAVGTVRRAIDRRVQEHLVQTVPGRGAFVIHS
jgi:DNA-binding GntR family transcriptional regulator